jgi:hypothetical protein
MNEAFLVDGVQAFGGIEADFQELFELYVGVHADEVSE